MCLTLAKKKKSQNIKIKISRSPIFNMSRRIEDLDIKKIKAP